MTSLQSAVFELSRKELYEKVWTTPMRTLAPTFGLSDVGLKKLCKRHNVPTPPVGHWAKKVFGKAEPQPPLPPDKGNESIRISFEPEAKPPVEPEIPPLPVSDPDLVLLVQYEKDPANKIVVSDQLHNPHPVTQRTKDAFGKESSSTRMNDLISPYSEDRQALLSLSVGKTSINRALRLMNALLVALEKRGFKINFPAGRSSDYYHRPNVNVEILAESFVFRLREKTRKVREEPDKTDRQRSWSSRTRYEPKGEFELTASREPWGSLSWNDTKRRPLEDRLNDVVIELIVEVERQRRYREQQKREAEERAREAEMQRDRERIERIEESRRKKFEGLTLRWELSHKLHVFAAAVREEHLRRQGGIEPGSDMALWLEWATDYASRVDPLSESRTLPKYDVPDPGPPSRW